VCVCYVGLAEIQLVASNNYLNFFFYRELHRDRCRRRRANNISQNGARRSCFSSFSFVNCGALRFFAAILQDFYVSRFFFILLFLYFFFRFLGHNAHDDAAELRPAVFLSCERKTLPVFLVLFNSFTDFL